MVEHAVSAQAGELIVNRLRCDTDVAGDLAIGHAPDGFRQQRCHHVGALKPVCNMECLGAEVSVAGVALETLYTVGALSAREETGLLKAPAGRYRIVKPAVAVGAMGWCELRGCV
jgi:hypothetical protein